MCNLKFLFSLLRRTFILVSHMLSYFLYSSSMAFQRKSNMLKSLNKPYLVECSLMSVETRVDHQKL